jgi:3-methyladenine DNA glycosylase/8-oxoguanine DNA glycosylase/predicted esterase
MTHFLHTDADLDAGLTQLILADPRLQPVAQKAGAFRLRRREAGFAGLCAIVCGQQLSTASAAAIRGRLFAAFDPFHHDTVRRARGDKLKRLGLSAAKIKAIKEIGKAVAKQHIDLNAVGNMPADEAHAKLTALHGVGPWTADIYLLFCLGHADAFPAGDLAVQEAARIALNLRKRPDPKALTKIAQAWRPWRGVAAHLLWAYYHAVKKRDVVPVQPQAESQRRRKGKGQMAELDGPRIEPRSGTARQLVGFLHGYGADGNDLIEIGRAWQGMLPHAAFVSPHAPRPCGQAPSGREWFPLTFRDPGERWTGVNAAAPVLNAFLDAELARRQLPPQALALVGFSQGTMMALHVGLRRAVAPAAIVGYSGMLVVPENVDPDAFAAEIKVKPPVLLIHGDQDELIPVQAVFHAAQGLAALDIPAEWHVSSGIGHGIDQEGLRQGGEFLARHFAARP